MGTKKCSKCGQHLPLKMFYTRTHSYCKSCYRVWRRKWRKTPAGRASEKRTQAKYKASEQVRAQKAEYNKRYKAKNALKMKAYSRAYNQSEGGKARNRRYHQSEKGKAAQRRFRQSAKRQTYLAQLKPSGKLAEYRRRFDQTEKGKAARHRINTSEKGKERQHRYARSLKGRATAAAKIRRYRQSPEFKRKEVGKRRLYRQSTKYKESVLKYRESGQQKKWTRRYNQSTKRKQVRHQYNQSAKGWEASQRDAFKRRAAFSKVEKSLARKDWQAILDKHNNTCFYCGVTGVKLTVDHKIPVSKGGPHVKSNVVPACKSCNSRKHSKLLPLTK